LLFEFVQLALNDQTFNRDAEARIPRSPPTVLD
jgi:hypothetical protein